MAFTQLPDGQLAYCYELQLKEGEKWFTVLIDTKNGQLLELVDAFSHNQYNVVPFDKNSPLDGFDLAMDANNPIFPVGWNNDLTSVYSDTRGNNADVRIGFSNKRAVQSSPGVFNTTWDPDLDPTAPNNQQAAAINVFFLINKMHDIFYQYGFTEASGNFQRDNGGKGGLGNDPVIAYIQSPDGVNNANFATPVDGTSPIMRMYIYTYSTPRRDGALNNDIVIHELTHGLTSRLTGGQNNLKCLQSFESRSLSEGWSDAMAMILQRTRGDNRSTIAVHAAYAVNNPLGNRRYPYTTDMSVNPETFSWFNRTKDFHSVGEIWATTLNEVYWNLVDAHGYADNWYDATQEQGNIVTVQLIIGGMMLQPCNPTFTQARDAILLADQVYYNSKHKCEIWNGFAKRGLGVDAVQASYIDGFSVPPECGNILP
ncbi:peptidase M36 [Gorgonomyces haynaldii]|nr:peptidase M36 [Gorgonomyces haynaldii]